MIEAPDGTEIPLSPATWYASVHAFALVLGGALAWARSFPGIKSILDGPVRVPIAALLLGAVGGALGQTVGWLTLEPYVTFGVPLGGLAFGLVAAIEAVTGVSLAKYLVGLRAKGEDGSSAASPDGRSPSTRR